MTAETSSARGGSRIPAQRALWISSLGLTAAVMTLLIWQCSSTFRQGQILADPAVREFHSKLNAGQYEEICNEADPGLAGEAKHAELVHFLEGVHNKLGNAGVSSRISIRVNATTFGGSIVAQYNTAFARGAAVETFTWMKKNSSLRLYAYDIRSNALVVN